MRAVFKWPRGHAKSVHLDVGIPLWLKFKGELHVMVLAGKSEDNADADEGPSTSSRSRCARNTSRRTNH